VPPAARLKWVGLICRDAATETVDMEQTSIAVRFVPTVGEKWGERI
jgi:hypothetical protein